MWPRRKRAKPVQAKPVQPTPRTYLPYDPAGWQSFWLAREDVVNHFLPRAMELRPEHMARPQYIELAKERMYRILRWDGEDVDWFFEEGPYDDRGPLWDRSCRHYTFADIAGATA